MTLTQTPNSRAILTANGRTLSFGECQVTILRGQLCRNCGKLLIGYPTQVVCNGCGNPIQHTHEDGLPALLAS